VTIQPLVATPDVSSDRSRYRLWFQQPAALRVDDDRSSGFLLQIRHVVSVAPTSVGSRGDRQIGILRYHYALLDRKESELLVYHWHPDSEGPDYPHLHVSASLIAQVDAQTRRNIDLDKLHIVTGHIALQAFIRMLITEFQVKPLRADWRERVAASATH
jgi:hypothetical protein